MSEHLCLGRVKSIESYHLNVSLLHGVKGRVRIADISLPYREALEKLLSGDKSVKVAMLNEMFKVGQIVRCSPRAGETITEVAMKSKAKPVALSLNPIHVNRNLKKTLLKPYVSFVGAVKSVEDHGYIVDTGISGLDIFLPFEETPLPENEKYYIGCLVELSIMDEQPSRKNSRVLRASMNKRVVVPDLDEVSFDCLLPGMRIPFKVTSTSLEGLDGSFRSFSVHVPALHCPLETTKFSIGSHFPVCIVDINLITKSIIASLLPHFVKDDLEESEGLMSYKHVKIGALIEDAVLKRRERNCVYLWLPPFKRCGILLKSNAFSENVPKKWTFQFPENTPVKCRVIDFDLFLNTPVISCKKSALESQLVTLGDVQVGTKVLVTVKKFGSRGISVRLAENIRGIIPYLHLSDVTIKNPQDRFKIKSKIQAMVLEVNQKKEEVLLTLKRSLISSSFPILGSSNMLRAWEAKEIQTKTNKLPATEPFIVTAFVIQASEKGVLVCGLNGVRGWLPHSHTIVDGSQSSEALFSKGETLQFLVLKRLQVSPQREGKPSTEFLLSQHLENFQPGLTSDTPVKLGEQYFCRVEEIKMRGLQVSLLKTPGSANVIASGFLPFVHLSDSLSISALARQFHADCFQPKMILSLNENGETPTTVVVVNLSGNEGIIVSAKPSLVRAAGASADSFGAGFLHSLEQLVIDSQWIGWVAHYRGNSMLVEFPGGHRGLVCTRYLSDRKAPKGTDWSSLLPPGSSVEAKVIGINGTRSLLSLRMIDTYTSAEEQYVKSAVARAEQYFEECRWIFELLSHLAQFTLGQVVKFHVDGLTEEVVTGWVNLPSSTSETQRVPAAALLLNTYEVDCALGGIYEAVVTLPNLDAGKLEVALLPWLLKSIKQRREGQFDSTAMQVRIGQVIPSSVVSMGNTRDVVVVALKQQGLGHLAVLPARRCFNDIIGANAWALGQLNRVTIRSEIPSKSKRERSFFATLSIYDPYPSKVPKKTDPQKESISFSTLEIPIIPGTRLPQVVFIGLKGRSNALFRLPNARGYRGFGGHLICRLVDLAPNSGKAIRKFFAKLPEPGTIFKNAVVLSAPTATLTHDGRNRGRLPLSSRVARISLIEKEPDVGDLVSAMFLGLYGASWRLLLPNNAQGLLHVSCMSKSSQTAGGESGHSQFPTHPAKGVWLTCRIIDQAVNLTVEKRIEEVDGKSLETIQNKDGPQLAKGDEVILIGDDEDEVPKMPTKVFYVSTDASDLRKWNPEKFKDLELRLNQPMAGIINHRFKNTLIVGLDYKTEVAIPTSAHSSQSQKLGSSINVVLTSLNPLQGRLAGSSRRRQRSLSVSTDGEGPANPKKRRRQVSINLESVPTIEDMRSRYAAFLPPEHSEEKKEDESKHADNGDNGDVEVVNESVKDAPPHSVFTDLANEARLAEVAKATSAAASGAQIPRMSSVEEFEVGVRNAPQNARLWSLYAAHHLAAGDIGRARAVLRRALASPSATLTGSQDFVNKLLIYSLRLESTAIIRGRNDEGMKNLEEIIHRIEQIDKEWMVKKALVHLSSTGLHEQADAMAKKFVKNHASLSEAWLNLIRVRFRAGNVTGAREAQRNAGQTLSLSQLSQFAIGCARLEYEFGDFERAIKLFEEQIAAHPQRKVLYTSYIRFLLSAGKTNDAEQISSTEGSI
ncbi:hypothetical protein Aperf_G00000063524 [Anoplocephala perfoliata]